MKTVLEVRRLKLRHELLRIDRQIAETQKQLAQLETRIALAAQPQSKAA